MRQEKQGLSCRREGPGRGLGGAWGGGLGGWGWGVAYQCPSYRSIVRTSGNGDTGADECRPVPAARQPVPCRASPAALRASM